MYLILLDQVMVYVESHHIHICGAYVYDYLSVVSSLHCAYGLINICHAYAMFLRLFTNF